MNYYLINNRVMKGGEMPVFETPKLKWSIYEHNHSIKYGAWLKSLQACSITESELEKVKDYLCHNTKFEDFNPHKTIDITSLVLETNGVVTFKQQEETNEEVYGYVAIHNNKIISGIYTHYHRIDEDYPNSNIYEIFKSKKFKN